MRTNSAANGMLCTRRPTSCSPDPRMLVSNLEELLDAHQRLQRDHFFALGLLLKGCTGAPIALQEVYEYCLAHRLPFEVGRGDGGVPLSPLLCAYADLTSSFPHSPSPTGQEWPAVLSRAVDEVAVSDE